jgi:RsiW-degrading membrane proteinase PrsW (M82 family)
MRNIFIGPLRHWLLFATALGILWLMGVNQFHTTNFKLFLLTLISLSILLLASILLTFRKGERITREPLDSSD